jgi:hypothetical protein
MVCTELSLEIDDDEDVAEDSSDWKSDMPGVPSAD